METQRYAVIRDGKIVNFVAWDGDEEKWKPGEGYTVRLAKDGEDVGDDA